MTAILSFVCPPHCIGADSPSPVRGGAAPALLLGIAVGLGAAMSPAAWGQSAGNASEIYVCNGPKGVPEYRNGNGGKGCKRLDLPDVVTVPVTRHAPRGGGNAAPAAAAASVASFPRVDAATQRRRDDERRAVLEHELRSEQAKLEALRAQYNDGQPERQGDERNYQRYLERTAALREDIARSEANAAALRRELANLKD